MFCLDAWRRLYGGFLVLCVPGAARRTSPCVPCVTVNLDAVAGTLDVVDHVLKQRIALADFISLSDRLLR